MLAYIEVLAGKPMKSWAHVGQRGPHMVVCGALPSTQDGVAELVVNATLFRVLAAIPDRRKYGPALDHCRAQGATMWVREENGGRPYWVDPALRDE